MYFYFRIIQFALCYFEYFTQSKPLNESIQKVKNVEKFKKVPPKKNKKKK